MFYSLCVLINQGSILITQDLLNALAFPAKSETFM